MKQAIVGLFVLIGLGVLILSIWVWRGVYTPVNDYEMAIEFTIESGSGVQTIAADLEAADLIRSPLLFGVYVRATGNTASLQAGDYTIATNASVPEIVDQLSSGNVTDNTVRVTLVEGWRSDQILLALQEAGLQITEEEFDEALLMEIPGIDERIYSGMPEDTILEGYLFPETYEFVSDATAEQVVTRLVQQFNTKVSPYLDDVEASDYTMYEILTIASIVERELLTTEERKIGAGIFLQRYDDNYPFESDATVNYVTGKKTTRPTFQDLEVESAYNTYKNVGLPPTPISNPSLDAIMATIYAERTDYYFFLTTPEGDAIFSKDFAEHIRNKNKYY